MRSISRAAFAAGFGFCLIIIGCLGAMLRAGAPSPTGTVQHRDAYYPGTESPESGQIPQTIEIIDAVYVIGPSVNAASFSYPHPPSTARKGFSQVRELLRLR